MFICYLLLLFLIYVPNIWNINCECTFSTINFWRNYVTQDKEIGVIIKQGDWIFKTPNMAVKIDNTFESEIFGQSMDILCWGLLFWDMSPILSISEF